MKYLIIVAHPDDEVLGAGASIYKWTHNGDKVDVCILCASANARAFRPESKELESDMNSAVKSIGVGRVYEGDFPNIEMNVVPHIQLVQFIEKAIVESEPDIVITHHPADPNNDHQHTSSACQEAIRLAQRRPNEIKHLREVWYMEIPSCSEWGINSSQKPFTPNCFVEVGLDAVHAKLGALSLYRGVMRPYPHPRSDEFITGLAAYRGGQFHMNYAEAFEAVLRRY